MKLLSLILLCFFSGIKFHNGSTGAGPECSVSFSTINAGFEVEGTLQLQNVEIKFDPENLRDSYINATANPATIQTGISIRDKHLTRSDYFDASRYPEVTLRSKSFKKKGKNNFVGTFDLTIKSITKEVVISFISFKENSAIRYQGSFEINRLDFNVGEASLTLDEKVKVLVTTRVQDFTLLQEK